MITPEEKHILRDALTIVQNLAEPHAVSAASYLGAILSATRCAHGEREGIECWMCKYEQLRNQGLLQTKRVTSYGTAWGDTQPEEPLRLTQDFYRVKPKDVKPPWSGENLAQIGEWWRKNRLCKKTTDGTWYLVQFDTSKKHALQNPPWIRDPMMERTYRYITDDECLVPGPRGGLRVHSRQPVT